MQGNNGAWTRNLKKKINIVSFYLITWMGQNMTFIYIYIFFLITVITQQKDLGQFFAELFLFWQLATLWNYTSLSSVSFGLIKLPPSTSALGGLVVESSPQVSAALDWAPSAKRKDHHGVSSGWSSVWHRSNTDLSSTQYEQIPMYVSVSVYLGFGHFGWLPSFFGQ